MKVLNLYAGIGGNRKLWEDVEVTAVEWDEQRAAVYANLFPNDTVIAGDAHQYLLDHYKEFDFIWSSPPCPTHGQMRYRTMVIPGRVNALYPDMRLWQEIIFLEKHAPGQYCVENVETYYEPLRLPQIRGRHYFWANFNISLAATHKTDVANNTTIASLQNALGINLDAYKMPDKRLVLRNCVHPMLGLHVLDCAKRASKKHIQEALL